MIDFNAEEMADVVHFRSCVEEAARKNNISLIFSSDSHIPYPTTKDLVNGYMVEFPEKQLAVATGKPAELWLPVLAHESSHMDQCLEKNRFWNESYVPGTIIETIDIVELWIEKKIELNPGQLDDYVRRSRNVELDCERRTVEKIKAFNLPIDIAQYIQKANSYVFFYTATKEIKSWYIPGKEPYNMEEVWSLCPETFLAEGEYENVPENLMQAYRKILQ